VFLFGLSAERDDARHNAESLRALSRLDILVKFADGSAAIISLNQVRLSASTHLSDMPPSVYRH